MTGRPINFQRYPSATPNHVMTCSTCGRGYPWGSPYFPFCIESTCLPCVILNQDRPSRRNWKAWKEDVARHIREAFQ